MLANTYELVLKAIGTLYDAACDDLAWPDAVEQLRLTLNGSKACFTRQGPNLHPGDAVSTDFDPAFIDLYLEEFSDNNELADAVLEVPVGQIYSDHALVGHDELRRSRLWNEWMAPQDMYGGLACKVIRSGSSVWFFDVQRGRNQCSFDARDVDTIQKILPHFQRAAELTHRRHLTDAMRTGLQNPMLGVAIVDAGFNIIAKDDVASRLMASAEILLAPEPGRIASPDSRALWKLQQLIQAACSVRDTSEIDYRSVQVGGKILLPAGGNGSFKNQLLISVGPVTDIACSGRSLHHCAQLLLQEIALTLPAAFEGNISELFKLTPVEARLAGLLVSGCSLKDAATHLGIGFGTARNYLIRIFRKTGTHQQGSLVAVLKTIQPLCSSRAAQLYSFDDD